ncbi:MAG: hypothetical protein NNA20_08245 [Nitrospira sp.]|nr:hypothetical protein [Nitrospira sp.]MCP9442571.1 hypothetical protein [Nitrospira sp.]
MKRKKESDHPTIEGGGACPIKVKEAVSIVSTERTLCGDVSPQAAGKGETI